MAKISNKINKHIRMDYIKIKSFKKGCCSVNGIEPVMCRKFTARETDVS
jgi:hypothetical protein